MLICSKIYTYCRSTSFENKLFQSQYYFHVASDWCLFQSNGRWCKMC